MDFPGLLRKLHFQRLLLGFGLNHSFGTLRSCTLRELTEALEAGDCRLDFVSVLPSVTDDQRDSGFA